MVVCGMGGIWFLLPSWVWLWRGVEGYHESLERLFEIFVLKVVIVLRSDFGGFFILKLVTVLDYILIK